MKVDELIQLLQAFNPEMKVVMKRLESHLEDIVSCYEGLGCQGQACKCDRSRMAGNVNLNPRISI